jgi:acyl carrier protein
VEMTATADHVPPRNPTEETLCTIWQDLLGVQRIGIHDNFFELGGHSLLAMRASAHIKKKLGVIISIHVLFQLASIDELSKYLEVQLPSDLKETPEEAFEVINI